MHTDIPALQRFDGAAIPAELKQFKRWTPWRAQWDAKRSKYDKLPVSAKQPEYGVSTAQPEKWSSFEDAVRTYAQYDTVLQGVGYLMTGAHGVVGFDLDNCVDKGVIAPWAQEIINSVNTYTEISPSGKGIRMFATGVLDGADWMNHEVGVEVYGGSAPRFLTVTGKHIAGTPTTTRLVPHSLLSGMRGTFGRASAATRPDAVPLPPLLAEHLVPAVHDLDLPPAAREFLRDGEHQGDRSRALHSAALALFSAGLSATEVFATLHHNAHAFAVALDHRRQDPSRADAYLWVEHCVAAEPKARSRTLTAADFDDVAEDAVFEADVGGGAASAQAAVGGSLLAGEGGGDVADDFDDVSGGVVQKPKAKPPTKKARFDIIRADHYVRDVKVLRWFYKGALPQANVLAIYGESGSGKTFLALDIVCKLALGMPWFGIHSVPTKILYVAAEGASGMRERMMAWCVANNVSISALGENLSVLGDQPNMLEKDDVQALVAAARVACPGIALVVLDTMAQVTPGANENSGEDMGRFLSNVRAVGKALKSTMLLIGHSGKDAMRGLRGWSGLRAALDAEIEVVRTQQYRAATVTKLKDGEGEGREYRFTLPPHVVDWDAEDDSLVASLSVAEAGVFDTSNGMSARETASSERKAGAKGDAPEAPTSKQVALGDKQMQVLEFLRGTLEVGVAAPIEKIQSDLCAHFATVKDFFTSAMVEKGNVKTEVKRLLGTLDTKQHLLLDAKYLRLLPDENCDF